jgi:hypothetical protein
MVIENQGHAPVSDEFWGVDAYEADTDYGTVLESHEISGGAYNNSGGTDSAE